MTDSPRGLVFATNAPGLQRQYVSVEGAILDWCRAIMLARPSENADHVRHICHQTLGRAIHLSTAYPLEYSAVASFLLNRTLAWALEGVPLANIPARLPGDLESLGALKIAEGGPDGAPLTVEALKNIPRIMQ